MVIMSHRSVRSNAKQPATKASPVAIRCLITGFTRFGPNTENSSQLVAESLPDHVKINGDCVVALKPMVLPTCCTQSWAKLSRQLRQHADKNRLNGKAKRERTILLLTGLAAKRDKLSLERFALNIRDFAIKDHGGHRYTDEPIEDGPEALRTSFPLQELRRHLLSAGFPCVISNHAGTFVCNDIYYRSLFFQAEHGTPDLVLFIHIPPALVFTRTARSEGNKKIRELAKASKSRLQKIELLKLAILESIKFCVNFLEQQENRSNHSNGQSKNGYRKNGRGKIADVTELANGHLHRRR